MPSGDPARDAEIQKIKRTILEHREADAKIKEYVPQSLIFSFHFIRSRDGH